MKRIDSYLVVGTGRSGTSTVARVMHEKLGISMGNEFVPSNEFNEKGYYEDVDFYRANLAFYDNQLFFGDWVCQIREILRERYKAGKPWGFKDSRMASLLGAYFTFLNEPKVIRCKRDSELVIASMIRCYGWSESKAKSVCESRETALDRVLVGRNQKDILTIHFGENHLPDEMIAKLIQKKWQKPIRLYVAILNKGWLRREITQRVLPQIKNTHGVEVYVEPFSLTWANPICSNRAKIMMRFLTHYPKQDFLLTMDDDCVPYFNPAKFVFSDKDVIGFPAPVRSTGQHLVWTAYTKHAERDGFVPVDFAAVDDNIDLLGVDVLGTGAIMIKRNVLEKLKHKQPFATPFDKYGQSKYGTDFAFCMKARKAGFEVFTAPNHFVEHFKEVPLLDLTGYDYPENFDLSNSKYKSPWGEWSITQKDWKFIKGTIKSEFGDKKIKILEFGCGLSSLLMSEKHKVISYEMDKEYADVVREKMTPDNDLEIRFWDGAEIKEKLGMWRHLGKRCGSHL